MNKNLGILLKNYSPKKQKVSLFDKALGRIEATFENSSQRQLNNGSLLAYHAQQTHNNLYSLNALEIIDIPFALARHDIYFLHHILELCYYFLPPQVTAPDTFVLLQAAFNQPLANKLLILLRFFTSISMYPEDVPFESSYFHRLLSYPIEIILKEQLDDEHHKQLKPWLLRCSDMHPYKKQFKTHYLLNRYVL